MCDHFKSSKVEKVKRSPQKMIIQKKPLQDININCKLESKNQAELTILLGLQY